MELEASYADVLSQSMAQFHPDAPLGLKAHSWLVVRLVALDAHGDAHAAADTKRSEAALGVAPLHFVKQCGERRER